MQIESTDALIVVDIQNDFCPGGALAVPDGDKIVPVVNRLMEEFATTVLTQDWHPPGHRSFASRHTGKKPFDIVRMAYGEQVLWPDHCVLGTPGAALHPDLETDHADLIIRKGQNYLIDSYSAFKENDRVTSTGLNGYLTSRRVKRVFVCGLALDFCVAYTALDAADLGYQPVVIEDACRAIDLNGSLQQTMDRFKERKVSLIRSDDL